MTPILCTSTSLSWHQFMCPSASITTSDTSGIPGLSEFEDGCGTTSETSVVKPSTVKLHVTNSPGRLSTLEASIIRTSFSGRVCGVADPDETVTGGLLCGVDKGVVFVWFQAGERRWSCIDRFCALAPCGGWSHAPFTLLSAGNLAKGDRSAQLREHAYVQDAVSPFTNSKEKTKIMRVLVLVKVGKCAMLYFTRLLLRHDHFTDQLLPKEKHRGRVALRISGQDKSHCNEEGCAEGGVEEEDDENISPRSVQLSANQFEQTH
ncbi:hypothetical protein BJY52DRAFT_1351920 [Lactarius psammicola]|nr:hypothetical protein BJY52DRAFT_1351920 [Lactarius psammicola]